MHERALIRVEAVTGDPDSLLAQLLTAELPGAAATEPEADGGDEPASAAATSVAQAPRGAVVVIAVAPGESGDPVLVHDEDVALLAGWGVDLPRRLARSRATGARGDLTWIDLERDDDPVAVVALGVGTAAPGELRRASAVATRRLRGYTRVLVLASRAFEADQVRAFTEGILLATSPITWSTGRTPVAPMLVRLAVSDLQRARPALARGLIEATATLRARQMIHTPSNLKDPSWMERQAGELAAQAGLDVRVWGPVELARDGFSGILAVGAGSERPPRLVRLGVGGQGRRSRDRRHVVLVGKGITFDSGGLSLKPADMQVPMKTDMSGSAVVCATLAALGAAEHPEGIRVTGLLVLAENLPGAGAMRPGDVVTHHGGLRTEVLNTDAEGRLVLGDALDYAVRDLHADVVVDIATLTGAATLGLGRRHAALFSNSDTLAGALGEAGAAAGEAVWRMPLHDGYTERLASEVADQANADSVGGLGPGAITAALFLSRFVGDTAWAHLDIAGVGRSDAERDELPKGGTGFGARLLLRWIEAGAPA